MHSNPCMSDETVDIWQLGVLAGKKRVLLNQQFQFHQTKSLDPTVIKIFSYLVIENLNVRKYWNLVYLIFDQWIRSQRSWRWVSAAFSDMKKLAVSEVENECSGNLRNRPDVAPWFNATCVVRRIFFFLHFRPCIPSQQISSTHHECVETFQVSDTHKKSCPSAAHL